MPRTTQKKASTEAMAILIADYRAACTWLLSLQENALYVSEPAQRLTMLEQALTAFRDKADQLWIRSGIVRY
jgi:hypothetical protein